MPLKQQLTKRIAAGGPLTVAQFMEACVQHYYATRDAFGKEGDFTTSPEISQIFGELLGAWVAECWQRIGSPKAILCELGPGRATLMRDMLRATKNIKGFHDAIDIVLVETSVKLEAEQKKTLQGMHPRITWKKQVDDVPALPLLLVANEFFDALPVHQHLRAGKVWQERRVGYKEGEFVFEPEGEIVCESSPASTSVMAHIATHIHAHKGAALIIDYGYTGGSKGNTLQAVKNHAYSDPLATPGETDITAHVDFDGLAHTAKGRGTHCWGAVEQGTFLKRLGAELRAAALCKNATLEQQKTVLSGLERLTAPHMMGTLFKVMAVTSFVDTPAGF